MVAYNFNIQVAQFDSSVELESDAYINVDR